MGQDKQMRKLINEVRSETGNRLDLSFDAGDEKIREIITQVVMEKSQETYIPLSLKYELVNRVFNAMKRLDILQPLLEDETITEIMVNAPDEIYIERMGRTELTGLQFESLERMESIIQGIVAKVNRTVNEAVPMVDARLDDGSRIHIVLPPIALKGPAITIRKFSDKPLTLDKLKEMKAITSEASTMLEKMVKAKFNIFISGGTGSGKTTFLNALADFIPEYERVITIEDSAELRLRKIKNLIRLETRNPNTEGKGEVSIRDLIRASLRMRPDRIIVGEVRGGEAVEMLQAMNTGHEGSISTGHGNTTQDMLNRLETMIMSAVYWPAHVVRQHIASALDIIIHLGRMRDGTRKVLEISEITGLIAGEIHLNPLFKFEEKDEEKVSECLVRGSLVSTGNKVQNIMKFKMGGIQYS